MADAKKYRENAKRVRDEAEPVESVEIKQPMLLIAPQ